MALRLRNEDDQRFSRLTILVLAAVATVAIVAIFVPLNAIAGLGLVALVWGVYAVARILEMRRQRARESAATNEPDLDALERDPETRLAGAGAFAELLRREIARHARHGTGGALLVVDTRIVNFRPSDEQAEPPSPATHIANVLNTEARATDIVCRLDMTRFAVFLAEATERGAEQFAERVRSRLSAEPFAENADGTGIRVRAWPGWARWEPEMRRPAHYLGAALAQLEEQRAAYDSEYAKYRGDELREAS